MVMYALEGFDILACHFALNRFDCVTFSLVRHTNGYREIVEVRVYRKMTYLEEVEARLL